MIKQTNSIMTVQDHRLRSCFKCNIQALNISPEMIQTISCSSKNPDFFSSESKTHTKCNLRIRRILYRIELPDRYTCFFSIIIDHFFRYTVKISHNVIRLDLMFIKKCESFIYSDNKFCLFCLKNWKDKIFFQHSPAHNNCSLTHCRLKSP